VPTKGPGAYKYGYYGYGYAPSAPVGELPQVPAAAREAATDAQERVPPEQAPVHAGPQSVEPTQTVVPYSEVSRRPPSDL
jgi:hypothetical protein